MRQAAGFRAVCRGQRKIAVLHLYALMAATATLTWVAAAAPDSPSLSAATVEVAAAVPVAPELTMGQAVLLALTRNRALIAARLQVDDAEVLRVVAGLYDNPEVSYSIANLVLGAGNPQEPLDLHPKFFEQRIQNVEISQTLDVWFKRSARRAAADAGLQVAHLQVQDAVREVSFAVRSAFATVLREQWESALAAEARQRYDETVNLSRKRHDAGEISEAELRKIELEKLKYVNGAINADHELAVARGRLATLLAYDSASALPAKLQEPPPLPRTAANLGQLQSQALQQRPDILAAQAQVQQAGLVLQSEERDAFPDLTVGVGYARSLFQISGDNPHTLGLSASLPIPLFNRNQEGVGRAGVEQRRANNAVLALALAVGQEVTEAVRGLGRAHAMLDIFETEMLQRADSALAVAEKSYKAGAVSLLELLEAQRTYLETRATYLETLYDWRQALVDVAYATGSELQ